VLYDRTELWLAPIAGFPIKVGIALYAFDETLMLTAEQRTNVTA